MRAEAVPVIYSIGVDATGIVGRQGGNVERRWCRMFCAPATQNTCGTCRTALDGEYAG